MWLSNLNLAINRAGAAASSGGGSVGNPVIRLSATTLSGLADGANVTSLTNLGSGGATYNATPVTGLPPTKQTLSGKTVMQFDAATKVSLEMATGINASANCSVIFVAWQTGVRMIALGGKLGAQPASFCGFSGSANANDSMLYRAGDDTGITQGLSTLAGLKVVGITIGASGAASNMSIYDNSTTPLTAVTLPANTYTFQKLGARDNQGAVDNQSSQGYLAEVLVYSSPLTNGEMVSAITYLKTLYGIA